MEDVMLLREQLLQSLATKRAEKARSIIAVSRRSHSFFTIFLPFIVVNAYNSISFPTIVLDFDMQYELLNMLMTSSVLRFASFFQYISSFTSPVLQYQQFLLFPRWYCLRFFLSLYLASFSLLPFAVISGETELYFLFVYTTPFPWKVIVIMGGPFTNPNSLPPPPCYHWLYL